MRKGRKQCQKLHKLLDTKITSSALVRKDASSQNACFVESHSEDAAGSKGAFFLALERLVPEEDDFVRSICEHLHSEDSN